jgi:hypothetical protein
MSNFKSMVEKMVEDQRRWQEHLDKVLEPQRRVQEQINKILEPNRRLLDAIEERSLMMERVIKQAEKVHAIQREAQKWIQKFQEPLIERLRMQETITESINLQKRLADQFIKIPLAQHFTWISEAQMHWAAGAEAHLSRFDPDTIKVTPRGDIVLDRETVNAEDVKSSLELLNKELVAVSTPGEYFQRIFSFLDRLNPRLAKAVFSVLFHFMLAILANLTTPIFVPWWKELTGLPKEEVATKIRENALNRYDPSQLKNHRFVTANRLQIRAAPGKEQRVIGTLPRGKLVRVIRSKQHWTKVEYLDERQQKERQGWVATSHLGKLTK